MLDNVLFPVILVAVVIFFVAIVRLFRNKKANYDERQLLARNAAYKGSFLFLLAYCAACGILLLFEVKWAAVAFQMFLGVVLSFVLFTALCIIKDAFLSDSPKRNAYAVLFFFGYGLVFFFQLMINLSRGEVLWDNGELTMQVLYPVASVCFVALGIISVIKILLDKRGAKK